MRFHGISQRKSHDIYMKYYIIARTYQKTIAFLVVSFV